MTSLRPWPFVAACSLWTALVLGSDAAALDQPGAVLANPLAAQPLDRLSATRERPLFVPSRRPAAPPPVAVARRVEPAPPPPSPPPSVSLLGIVWDDEDAQAIVRPGTSDKVIHVRVGDEIAGWKVTQLDRRQLVLSLEDRSATFELFKSRSASKGAPNPQAGNAAEGQPRRRRR